MRLSNDGRVQTGTYLIDCRFDFGCLDDCLELSNVEVTHAYAPILLISDLLLGLQAMLFFCSLGQTVIFDFLKFLPVPFKILVDEIWEMKQVQVQLFDSELCCMCVRTTAFTDTYGSARPS